MRSAVRSLTALLFFIWILPLGIFFKPSLEKVACDGQRAICLCHKYMFNGPDKPLEAGINLKAAAAAQKEDTSGGSAGQYFASTHALNLQGLQLASSFEEQYLRYKNPHLASLDHVPKVSILS